MNKAKTHLQRKATVTTQNNMVYTSCFFFFAYLKDFENKVYLDFRIKERCKKKSIELLIKIFANDTVKENL